MESTGKIRKLWTKYKSYILYLIFGGVTTLVNWLCFYVCAHLLHMGTVPANIIAWIVAVVVAYLTNRKWVFESRASGAKRIIKEVAGFTVSRLVTLGVETLLMWVTVDICGWNDLLMKIIVNIIVVIMNYIFSRFIVFRPEKESNHE